MSVMRPEDLRNAPNRPLPIEPAPMQRQALIDQLGTSPSVAQPVASNPGTFARGGQVKQLPGFDKNKIAEMGAGTAANVAGKVLGNTAGGAAAGMGVGLATGALADKLKVKEEMPTFGGPNGKYLDDFGRRFEGTGGGIASNAVRYAGMGANPALVAATGGLSVAAGAIGGAIKGALTKNAPSAFTDFRVEDAAEGIKAAYRGELGREASDDEVMTHLKNTGFDPTGGDRWSGEKPTNYIINTIRDSPEAQAFRARGSVVDQLGTGAPAAGSVATNDVEPRTASMTAPAAGGAAPAGGGGRLEGFDAGKLASGHDSPKYQVARVLQKYPSTPDGLKAALPELQALGIGDVAIGGSKGDKLTFSGAVDPRFEGVTTFDVIRAAGNGGEAWQWLGEGQGGAAPAAGGGASAPNAAGAVALGAGQAGQPPALDGETLARLKAELERIMSGQPDRQALLAQMGGANG